MLVSTRKFCILNSRRDPITWARVDLPERSTIHVGKHTVRPMGGVDFVNGWLNQHELQVRSTERLMVALASTCERKRIKLATHKLYVEV